MLNVAMLSYHTCPLATLGGKDTGGMNVYVRELTHHLGKQGVHVDVFTRSQDEHVPHVLHDLGYGNRVVHVPSGPETPRPKSELPQYLPQFVEGVQRFADEKHIHYDLVHSHYWLSGLAAETLKDRWDVPWIHMFHTLGLMKNQIAQSSDELEPQVRIDGERRILEQADCIVAATPAEQSQIDSLYHITPKKLVVIPPGVDTSRFYPIPSDEARQVIGIPNTNCLILFVGRIEPLKGIDTLIRAIALLIQQHPMVDCPHYLAVIGGDPDASQNEMSTEMVRLQALSKELKINDLVIFLGKRSQDSLPYYYSAAQVVVVPSHYESFGMVALEAMACGTPVVASQVGGLAFLVQDGVTGYVVPNGDPQTLADHLAQLLEQSELRAQLGRQAEAYAQDYEWDKITSRILGVYHQLLNPEKLVEREG
ncbi:MAG: glycosyltransferase [Anaerolineaceae bacterium]|jgi:D-inositol-3-phosphate glycosyltransferase